MHNNDIAAVTSEAFCVPPRLFHPWLPSRFEPTSGPEACAALRKPNVNVWKPCLGYVMLLLGDQTQDRAGRAGLAHGAGRALTRSAQTHLNLVYVTFTDPRIPVFCNFDPVHLHCRLIVYIYFTTTGSYLGEEGNSAPVSL